MENKNQVQQLQIIFGAFLVAQLAFCVAVFFLVKPTIDAQTRALTQYFPILPIAMLLVGYFIYRQRIFTLLDKNPEARMSAYRAASVLKWAFFEGATLFTLIFYFEFGDVQLLYLGAALVVHFAIHFPSNGRIARETGLEI